jgi:hypothetical protein
MLDFLPSGSEAGSIPDTSHTKRTEGMGTAGLRRIPSAPPPPKGGEKGTGEGRVPSGSTDATKGEPVKGNMDTRWRHPLWP